MLLGCIGDDFTGSSDLANTLAKAGMRTVQYSGVPDHPAEADVQAAVVALKTRSIPAAEAVAQSLKALEWLLAQGCAQIYFKYCSTFDSTAKGNIGPVAEALADALEARAVIICPAFPGTGRSIYQGHLFVKDVLLSESGMQNHPLTPMTDPDIRRVLAAQSKGPVGHVDAATVLTGATAIRAQLDSEAEAGRRLIVVDALQDADLMQIGRAAKGLKLITGGSGAALGLPANFGIAPQDRTPWRGEAGKCVILSGSCSIATRGQIAQHKGAHPSMEVSADMLFGGEITAQSAADWAMKAEGLPLIYSSADPQAVAAAQEKYGRAESAEKFEQFFAAVARIVTAEGVRKLLTAGGETSGAVVEGLSLTQLEIGPEIDPGVPALRAGAGLVLALKSGNFGSVDYFEKAARILDGTAP
ncbi:3-oxo-tetronate kinase [Sulfitobacter sp. PS-8MA]|uniref:3-oxo-tetronate kinase n=1 Tax=Sulfitobacter sp. PS-8MA TaxID=3237707 RepID=UPI0034C676EA